MLLLCIVSMPRWRNGRRARFRCECLTACRFESYPGHEVEELSKFGRLFFLLVSGRLLRSLMREMAVCHVSKLPPHNHLSPSPCSPLTNIPRKPCSRIVGCADRDKFIARAMPCAIKVSARLLRSSSPILGTRLRSFPSLGGSFFCW